MTNEAELAAGEALLTRAKASDLGALVALQRSAYARNRSLLGVEPLPLLADYEAILRDMEVWLARLESRLAGALILEARAEDLLVWSIAVDPAAQGARLGAGLLRAAETRARALGLACVRLYTGTTLEHLVAWYTRAGYAVERVEVLSDRSITHMIKHLPRSSAEAVQCYVSPLT